MSLAACDAVAAHFPTTMARELLGLVCGEMLGGGATRQVFALRTDPRLVVKFETADRKFQNFDEWALWHNSPDALRWWMAPCEQISPCGRILIQRRCDPCPADVLPWKVPAVFRDVRPANWGLYEGRPVAFDYAYHGAFSDIDANVMQEVEWT